MSVRMETVTKPVRYCDRCSTNPAYLVDVPDGSLIAPREIDLCRGCTDEVFPDLFKPVPKHKRAH